MMKSLDSSSIGILMQGKISSWTNKIVEEYRKNFPKAKILISTWTDENVKKINCDVIQIEPPKPTHPYQLNVNFQKKVR